MSILGRIARDLTPAMTPLLLTWVGRPDVLGVKARRWLIEREAKAMALHGPASMADFEAHLARLGPGDLVLDLGANLGHFTQRLADTGAEVHAFEPDPHCFAKLTERFGGRDNVHLHPQAVADRAGQVFLRRTRDFASDPDLQSTSSTIVATGPQYEDAPSLSVEVVAFGDLVRSFNRPVALVKMDIEGAEFGILEQILADQAKGIVLPIGKLFVETHERSFPERISLVRALRRARNLPYPIDTYWP